MTSEKEAVVAIVQRCVDEWRGHKTYAWAGECGFFADRVYHLARSQGLHVGIDSFNDALDCNSPVTPPPGVTLDTLSELGVLRALNHVWIVHADRHYNAASPDGVDNPLNLRGVRQSLVEMLREKNPYLLSELSMKHAWWQESENLTDGFLAMLPEREAQYEEN